MFDNQLLYFLNPEDARSLIVEPITVEQQQNAAYWKKRPFIYNMGNLTTKNKIEIHLSVLFF